MHPTREEISRKTILEILDDQGVDPDLLLTISDTATLLGVNSVTLSYWRKNGTGPHWIKLPPSSPKSIPAEFSVRYRHGDLVQFIRSLRHIMTGPDARIIASARNVFRHIPRIPYEKHPPTEAMREWARDLARQMHSRMKK